jgi:hypothetical protein
MNHSTIEQLRPRIEESIIYGIVYENLITSYMGYLSVSNFKCKTDKIPNSLIWNIAIKHHKETPHIPISPMVILTNLPNEPTNISTIASLTPTVSSEVQYLSLILLELSFRTVTHDYLLNCQKEATTEQKYILQDVCTLIKDTSNDVFESIENIYFYLKEVGHLEVARGVAKINQQINQKIKFIKGQKASAHDSINI